MKITTKIFVGFFALLLVSCSTKKNAFLNRSFHSVGTKYNVLFNGNEALEKGLQELNANYTDNYWEILPIEPLKVDVLALPGMKSDVDTSPKSFETAEEKAVKAIQKHSMVIGGKQRNKQIDNAYLLLGKARYYSKRFVPALEAFNYLTVNYSTSNLMNENIIWQSKTQIRLQNEKQAVANLNYLLKRKKVSGEIKEAAHTAMAMAFMQNDSLQMVIHHLKKATASSFNKEQTARNLFILGQLYSIKNHKDSSNTAFKKILDLKKAPYKYKIHAQLEMAKNVSNKLEAEKSLKILNKLIDQRENRSYLNQLYYRAGIIYKEKDANAAIDYFKKSLQANSERNLQKEITYEAIGNVYFNKADFVTAGAYYDSILNIAQNKNEKRVRSLARKRNNLNEVIYYENIIKDTDSLLNIAGMSKEAQTEFFETYIEKLKKSEELQQQRLNFGAGIIDENNNFESNQKGKWYFYNMQTLGFGEQEFKRVWGNRPLVENWRLSDKMQLNVKSGIDENLKEEKSNIEAQYLKLSYYLNRIPTKKKQLDSLATERNNAYYKLGVIYKEQFNRLDLAEEKLQKLLYFNPKKDILLQAKYHLFRIYEMQKNPKAADLKKDIIDNYSNSKYAKIILNPNSFTTSKDENLAESEYEKIYEEYKKENFENVIEKSTIAVQKFEGQPIVKKYELLRAHAIGKLRGVEAFKEALELVVKNYPNTAESEKAATLLEMIKTKIKP